MTKKKNDYGWSLSSNDYLAHFGILGMKWGVRRYQNEDGSWTEAGRKRYHGADFSNYSKGWQREFNTMRKYANGSSKKNIIKFEETIQKGNDEISKAIKNGANKKEINRIQYERGNEAFNFLKEPSLIDKMFIKTMGFDK